jgi:octaprenyl-diphosphate synthase
MDSDRRFSTQFEPYVEAINQALTKPLSTHVPMIEDIGYHSLLGKGKRLRPLLFVLSAQICGYSPGDVYHFSTIFEYLHTASLLHDDVLDNAEMRRKKPSARNIWGNSAAVLGGDYLYARASAVALESDSPEIMKVLNETATRMVEGQFLELAHTHDWHISKEQYVEIIVSKTAELMAAACACGGLLAGAESTAVEHLRAFGLNLGIAFQLIDDTLDYTSCEEEFGKPVGKDLREGKITLPLIYALIDLGEAEASRLEERFKNQKANDADYVNMITMVRDNGIHDRVRSEAKRFARKGAGFLEYFPDSPVKKALLALNSYVIERSY